MRMMVRTMFIVKWRGQAVSFHSGPGEFECRVFSLVRPGMASVFESQAEAARWARDYRLKLTECEIVTVDC